MSERNGSKQILWASIMVSDQKITASCIQKQPYIYYWNSSPLIINLYLRFLVFQWNFFYLKMLETRKNIIDIKKKLSILVRRHGYWLKPILLEYLLTHISKLSNNTFYLNAWYLVQSSWSIHIISQLFKYYD